MTGLRDPDHQISLGWSGLAPAFSWCGGPDQPWEIWWSRSRNPVILLFYEPVPMFAVYLGDKSQNV